MKNLLSIFSLLLVLAFLGTDLSAQTSRTRVSTVIRASQIMLDTLTDADTLAYYFPGRSNPFAVQFHFKWSNLSGTVKDSIYIYGQGEPAVRLNTTNTTTGSTTTGADYIKLASFVIGATGLVGGAKDTTFSLSCNGLANIQVYHKSTGTQSTRVKAHAKIYTATNNRAQ